MDMKKNQTSFHGRYLNLTAYVFLSKCIKVFQWLSKLQFLSFMTKVNPSNGNETKSDILPMDILKFDIVFIGRKILKYFNYFYNWHFSISLQKWAQSRKWNKITRDTCKSDSICFIYKAAHYLNDFWNLFVDKIYY